MGWTSMRKPGCGSTEAAKKMLNKEVVYYDA